MVTLIIIVGGISMLLSYLSGKTEKGQFWVGAFLTWLVTGILTGLRSNSGEIVVEMFAMWVVLIIADTLLLLLGGQ